MTTPTKYIPFINHRPGFVHKDLWSETDITCERVEVKDGPFRFFLYSNSVPLYLPFWDEITSLCDDKTVTPFRIVEGDLQDLWIRQQSFPCRTSTGSWGRGDGGPFASDPSFPFLPGLNKPVGL